MKYFSNIKLGAIHFFASLFDIYVPRHANYFLSVAVALDQFCNAILGGDPAETISSRAAKARNEGKQWGCILCKVLSIIIQKNHCTKSLDANVGSNSIIPD